MMLIIAGKPNPAPTATTSSGGSSRPNYFGGATAGVNNSSGGVFDDKNKTGYTGRFYSYGLLYFNKTRRIFC